MENKTAAGNGPQRLCRVEVSPARPVPEQERNEDGDVIELPEKERRALPSATGVIGARPKGASIYLAPMHAAAARAAVLCAQPVPVSL